MLHYWWQKMSGMGVKEMPRTSVMRHLLDDDITDS